MYSKSREGRARKALLPTSIKVSSRLGDVRTVGLSEQTTWQTSVCGGSRELVGMSRGLVSWIQHLILSIQPTWCGLESMALRIKYSKRSLKSC